MTVTDNRGGREAGSVLAALLAAGSEVTYEPDPVWDGHWYADLRDAKGRCVETGSGATQAAALASLRERCERSEPAALAVAAVAKPREDQARADLTSEDRCDMVGVMTDHEREWLLAFIAGHAPGVFDAALAARSQTFADELWDRVDAKLAEEAASDPDGYCTVCGANVSWFYGYDGPQHFRGPHKLVTGAERRQLFDAGHEPIVAWRYPQDTTPAGAQQ